MLASVRDDPTVNHTSEWESVEDLRILILPHLALRGMHLCALESLTFRCR